MYALYRKIVNGYSVDVNVLAVSKSKEELMALLPYEVERYIRSKVKRLLPFEINRFYLNGKGHEPREYWARGAFDEERFEVVEVMDGSMASLKCFRELNELRDENKKYLQSIGITE